MNVYMLVAPVYSWDDGTYTIGVYKSMDAAINAAKEHTDPQDAKAWGEYASEYKIITRELLE